MDFCKRLSSRKQDISDRVLLNSWAAMKGGAMSEETDRTFLRENYQSSSECMALPISPRPTLL
jgi:hypothetical protein